MKITWMHILHQVNFSIRFSCRLYINQRLHSKAYKSHSYRPASLCVVALEEAPMAHVSGWELSRVTSTQCWHLLQGWTLWTAAVAQWHLGGGGEAGASAGCAHETGHCRRRRPASSQSHQPRARRTACECRLTDTQCSVVWCSVVWCGVV